MGIWVVLLLAGCVLVDDVRSTTPVGSLIRPKAGHWDNYSGSIRVYLA